MKTFKLPLQLFKLFVSLVISDTFVSYVVGSFYEDGLSNAPLNVRGICTVCAVILAIAAIIIIDYNEICKRRSIISKAREDINSSTEIRKTLVDKAQKIVDKYMDKEASVYIKYAEARKVVSDSAFVDYKNIVEKYPELKTNVNVQRLLNQLETTENLILETKNRYTTAVSEYNAGIHSFPVSIICSLKHWTDEDINALTKDELLEDGTYTMEILDDTKKTKKKNSNSKKKTTKIKKNTKTSKTKSNTKKVSTKKKRS